MHHILKSDLESVENALEARLPSVDSTDSGRLCEAMRYAVLGGGKRLRPLMVLASCRASGSSPEMGLDGACAVEMIHAYSLVHDDLPAMDDDDERRGRLSCHKAFGEATAILAGDALLTLAFEVLSDPAGETPQRSGTIAVEGNVDSARLRAVVELAKAVGWAGLVGGQSLDLAYEGAEIQDMALLERIHRGKTGALFMVSCVIGGLLGGATAEELEKLREYGEAMGLAFQHIDDVLDNEHERFAAKARVVVMNSLERCEEISRGFEKRGEALIELVRVFSDRMKNAV